MKLDDLIIIALSDEKIYSMSNIAYMLRKNPDDLKLIIEKMCKDGYITCECQAGKTNYYKTNKHNSSLISDKKDLLILQGHLRSHNTWIKDKETCYARTCYGHLAGKVGIALRMAMLRFDMIKSKESNCQLTFFGRKTLLKSGLKVSLTSEKIKNCLDGSERRYHIGGPCGRKIAFHFIERGWILQNKNNRAVTVTQSGKLNLKKYFGLELNNISILR